MIDFIVTGMPRSGTTWVANWLTTDDTLCLHDPLYQYKLDELDTINSNKRLGISCTGMWRFTEFLKTHTAKKLIIHRDIKEINDSLVNEMGVPTVSEDEVESLWNISGLHVSFLDLFNPVTAKNIYEYLLEKPFDFERHEYLTQLNIQPNFGKISFNKAALDDFRQRCK